MDMEKIQPPEAWKPQESGDSVEGVLIRKETDVGVNKSNLYHLDNKGIQASVWGSTVLDRIMGAVEEGTFVKIIYKGTEKNKKGQDTKIFEVFKEKKV